MLRCFLKPFEFPWSLDLQVSLLSTFQTFGIPNVFIDRLSGSVKYVVRQFYEIDVQLYGSYVFFWPKPLMVLIVPITLETRRHLE